MSELKYRIGIDPEENAKRIKERTVGPGRGSGQWHTDSGTEPEVVSGLAAQIRKDLKVFLVNHYEHGSGKTPYERLVSAEERNRIICKALLLIAEELQTHTARPN